MSSAGMFLMSVVIAAAGAVMRWGIVDAGGDGIDLTTIGLIALIAGLAGAAVALAQMAAGHRTHTEVSDGDGRTRRVLRRHHGPLT